MECSPQPIEGLVNRLTEHSLIHEGTASWAAVRTGALAKLQVVTSSDGSLSPGPGLGWASVFIKVYSAPCLAKINRVPGTGGKVLTGEYSSRLERSRLNLRTLWLSLLSGSLPAHCDPSLTLSPSPPPNPPPILSTSLQVQSLAE